MSVLAVFKCHLPQIRSVESKGMGEGLERGVMFRGQENQPMEPGVLKHGSALESPGSLIKRDGWWEPLPDA